MPILTPKPAPPKPKVETDLKTLADAANEAAKREAAQWFYFVTIMITVAALVGSTTHRVLFLEEPVRVPFLGVELPLLGFYVVVPAIFLVLHFYTLAQLRLMARKLRAFLDELDRQTGADTNARERALQRLDSFSVLQLLVSERYGTRQAQVRMMAWTTLVVAPVLLLLFFQVRFLPYHSEWITWWHRVLILVDLALVWWLWPSFAGPRSRRFWHRPILRWGAATAVVTFAVLVASVPEEAAELHGPLRPLRTVLFDGEVDPVSQRPTSLFSRNLVLPDEDFVPEDDARLGTMARTRVLRGRDLRYAVLDRTDLRRADFTGAQLDGASLVRANVAGASFAAARLRSASLVEAYLQGANLDEAELHGALLVRAGLQGASLAGTILNGASLNSAQAQGAHFGGAQLRGAVLDGAQFQGALFVVASFDGASMSHVAAWRLQAPFTSLQSVAVVMLSFDGNAPCIGPALHPGTSCVRARNWQQLVEVWLAAVPDGPARSAARQRLAVVVDDADPLDAAETRAVWSQQSPGDPAGVAQILTDLACDAANAPHVARGLMLQLRADPGRVGHERAAMAARISNVQSCPGARGLSDKEREELVAISQNRL